MQLRPTEPLRRRVGVIHRSWNKRRSPTPDSVWPSPTSRQADVRRWYNEWLTQNVTWCFTTACVLFLWFFFFFFLAAWMGWGGEGVERGGEGWGPRAELIGVTRCEGAHSCPLPSLSSTLGAFVITHRALWQTSPKNVCDRTFPGNTAESRGESRGAKQNSLNVAHADDHLKPSAANMSWSS